MLVIKKISKKFLHLFNFKNFAHRCSESNLVDIIYYHCYFELKYEKNNYILVKKKFKKF